MHYNIEKDLLTNVEEQSHASTLQVENNTASKIEGEILRSNTQYL